VFLPTGAIVLGLWLTGMYLWLLPYWTRRKSAAIRAAQAESKSLAAAGRGEKAARPA
jgi:hypothetical protein